MITLRQIRNHDHKVQNHFMPCDEGWFAINFTTGVKKIFLKSTWEAVPVAYQDCSIRIEDTCHTRYLIVDEVRVAFEKNLLITWLGNGTVKFQREVKF